MLDRDTVIKTLKNYAREISEQGVNLQKVILFGSFAKGTQHEWSDIDVALVADEFQGIPQDMRRFAAVSIKKPYLRIEAQTYPTDYFNEGDPLIAEIIETGVNIL